MKTSRCGTETLVFAEFRQSNCRAQFGHLHLDVSKPDLAVELLLGGTQMLVATLGRRLCIKAGGSRSAGRIPFVGPGIDDFLRGDDEPELDVAQRRIVR